MEVWKITGPNIRANKKSLPTVGADPNPKPVICGMLCLNPGLADLQC